MRVLHLNTMDKLGGAARAAQRIHMAQRSAGIDSHLYVLHRLDTSPGVQVVPIRAGKIGQRLRQMMSERIAARQITPTNCGMHSINAFNSGVAAWINRSDFDLVNLHWLGNELISIEEIAQIQKPIFWTMHDMWPFSGAEHIDDLDHPGRYITGYGPGTRPAHYRGPDLDAWLWRRKKRAWAKKKFNLISPSHWLARCAAASDLMKHQPCTVIPNCVDTDIFKPVDRRLARQILNLNPDRKYILFGSISSTNDRNKGFHLLQPAIQRLAQHNNIRNSTELLVFGAHTPDPPPDLGLPTHYLGNFSDEISLALLYSAADVLATPSMQENLPNTIIESICCGTPCVAFEIGGIKDIIDTNISGALAPPFDGNVFSELLINILTQTTKREVIREAATSKYAPKTLGDSYLSHYKNAIKL